MSFTPKEEMWWDLKLLLKRKLPIGVCTNQSGEVPIAIQGALDQDLFYADSHILSRKGNTILRGNDFDFENIYHFATLLILVRYHDQSG